MPVFSDIRPETNFDRKPDSYVRTRGWAVVEGFTNYVHYFPNPTVPIVDLKAATDSFSDSMAAVLDGGRLAFAEKAKRREEVCKILRQLGPYAAACARNDMTIFITSGFKALTQTFKAPQPLDTPRILKIAQGLSGELIISISSLGRDALQYILRYGVVLNAGHPESWTEVMPPYTGAKPPKSITGLTPGIIYAFQVKAYSALGFTDWSDSVTHMCI